MRQAAPLILLILLVSGAALLQSPQGTFEIIDDARRLAAGIFFVASITEEELITSYTLAQHNQDVVRVLIVPGHDDVDWGTSYRGMKEADLNLALAEYLVAFLEAEGEFDVTLSRDRYGYNREFIAYFNQNREAIDQFRASHRSVMNTLIDEGLIDAHRGIRHNRAPSETVLRLYGFNKWANDTNIDIVIHVHFNDYAGRGGGTGEYSGLAIYIPEQQFSNAGASRTLAENVFARLTRYFASSNIGGERAGIIEDQKLIAIGAYNTLDPAVLFMEYGYIYETQYFYDSVRPYALRELAFQTVEGLKDFLKPLRAETNDTATLPYVWDRDLRYGVKRDADVFALQVAFARDGLYPPFGRTKNQCPLTGNFGSCTDAAVRAFQAKYNLMPIDGIVGPLTRAVFSVLYAP